MLHVAEDCMLHECLSVYLLLCMQGFGFVTFASSMNAEAARLAMNGAVVDGRKIEVQQQFHFTLRALYSVVCHVVDVVSASPSLSNCR